MKTLDSDLIVKEYVWQEFILEMRTMKVDN
jgi:hypothetical protein